MTDNARILVVDDDPLVRLLLETVLKMAGYGTASADTGAEALRLLDQDSFDLVVTDKNLAGMDGHMLISEMGHRHPQVGAVMITGFRSEESERRARDQHVLGYLVKPISDLAQVTQTIDSAVREQRRRTGIS